MKKDNINLNQAYVKAQQIDSEKLKQTKEDTSSNKLAATFSNWKFWIILVVAFLIILSVVLYGFSRLSPLIGIIIIFLSLFLCPKYVKVCIKAHESDPEKLKQIKEEISGSKLATFLSSKLFWLSVPLIFATYGFISSGGGPIYRILFLAVNMLLMFPISFTLGFANIFEMLIPSKTLDGGAFGNIISTLILLLTLSYIPFIFTSLYLIIKRKINSRLIITLSLIVLLLLFLGFYGCENMKDIGSL